MSYGIDVSSVWKKILQKYVFSFWLEKKMQEHYLYEVISTCLWIIYSRSLGVPTCHLHDFFPYSRTFFMFHSRVFFRVSRASRPQRWEKQIRNRISWIIRLQTRSHSQSITFSPVQLCAHWTVLSPPFSYSKHV